MPPPFKTLYTKTKRGRRKIKTSQGEFECMDIFEKNGILYKKQVRLPKFGRNRYDFQITFNNITYMIELDGEQHFRYNSYFCKSESIFKRNRTKDVMKTLVAILRGYCVIRIAYGDRKHLLEHLQKAFHSHLVLYVSNLEKYQWLLEAKIHHRWLQKYIFF